MHALIRGRYYAASRVCTDLYLGPDAYALAQTTAALAHAHMMAHRTRVGTHTHAHAHTHISTQTCARAHTHTHTHTCAHAYTDGRLPVRPSCARASISWVLTLLLPPQPGPMCTCSMYVATVGCRSTWDVHVHAHARWISLSSDALFRTVL